MPTLLFDIDGTLVRTGGAGKAAMEAALRSAFGVRDINDTVPYSGRTDVDIAGSLLLAHDMPPTPEHRTRLTEAYLDHLPRSLADRGGEVCPGIEPILTATHSHPDVLLGLLTGNIRRGARTKLAHFDLWDYFPVGGFGDKHSDRDDVAREALAEVHRHTGRAVDPSDVWVIGDTPLDVRCARAVGAKVIAVATGWHPLAELEACRPDVALPDLADVPGVLRMWGLG
jgi:phosphoglycolate phosphatase-like HAD superfamily hydrolase